MRFRVVSLLFNLGCGGLQSNIRPDKSISNITISRSRRCVEPRTCRQRDRLALRRAACG